MVSCGLYVRVSTELQLEKGFSIPEQTDRLEKYCEALGWNNYKVYTDGGFSGANMNRPALQELIKDVEKKKINKVIVYKLDRLSRSQKDTLYLIEDVFLKNGCDFISISESFDTNSAFGIAMLGILSVFAQLERQNIKDRMTMGKLARAKLGKYHGGVNDPIGYDYKDGGLVINEYEAEQVRIMFDLYEQGYSPGKIAEYMNERGYKTKYGKWAFDTAYKLIPKKLFIGILEYKGKEYPGEHEPIISAEQFENCQRIRERRCQNVYDRRDGSATSYLGGLLVCAKCGEKYRKRDRIYKSPVRGNVKYNYYICKNRNDKTGKDKCKNKTWDMDELDGLIFDEIRKLRLENVNYTDEVIKPSNSRQIERLNKQINKLMDLYSVGGIPIDLLQEKIKEINDQKSTLEIEQSAAEEREKEKANKSDVVKAINELDEIISSGDFVKIRMMLNALIEKIVIDGEDITIYWNFS